MITKKISFRLTKVNFTPKYIGTTYLVASVYPPNRIAMPMKILVYSPDDNHVMLV